MDQPPNPARFSTISTNSVVESKLPSSNSQTNKELKSKSANLKRTRHETN